MISDICGAQHYDRKVKSGIIIESPEVKISNVLQINLAWLDELREWCADSVICRTVHSCDNNGHPISGMPPYREHLLRSPLLPAEKEVHDQMIQNYLDDGASEWIKNRKVRVIVILHGRLRAVPFLGILCGLANGPHAPHFGVRYGALADHRRS